MFFNFVFNVRLFQEAQKWITLSKEKSILKYFPVSESYFYVNFFFLIAESAITFTHDLLFREKMK